MLQSSQHTPARLLKAQRAVTELKYLAQGWREPSAAKLPATIHSLAPQGEAFRDMSFTFAVIALSAHVARAGSAVSRESYVAFRDAFPLSGGLCGKLRALFMMACQNTAPIEHYLLQIKALFPRRRPLFSSLVERLFSIAAAGGKLSQAQERMLARIAHALELPPADFSRIHERYTNPKPHQVLGVPRRTPVSALKKRYRELMLRYHPDRFASHHVSPEIELLLQLKASEINEAYQRMTKKPIGKPNFFQKCFT